MPVIAFHRIHIIAYIMNNQLKRKRVTFNNALKNKEIIDLLRNVYLLIEEEDHKARQKIKLAISSVDKYPLQINSGEECIILQGFDKTLCKYVNDKLFNKNKMPTDDNNPNRVPNIPYEDNEPNILKSKVVEINDEDKKDVDTDKMTKLPDKPTSLREKPNLPEKPISLRAKSKMFRDALLLAMYIQQVEHPSRSGLTKTELMIKAQEHCEETIEDFSFVKVLEKKKKLLQIELVDGIEFYKLTHLGEKTAKDNVRKHKLSTGKCSHCGSKGQTPRPNIHLPVLDLPYNCSGKADDAAVFIDMPPGSYEVIMLVDKNEPEMFTQQTKGKNLKSESRSLKVGDITWVARSKINGLELVLPFTVERKRMDDFSSSVKDGRFHEQKFRLRKCGLRNVIYLIEDYKGNKHSGLSMATLNQAMINTRVQDGFMIQRTDCLKSTKRFLDRITMWLGMELEEKHLRGTNTDSGGKELMTFDYFNAASSKTKSLTVKELFIKMLLQLKGLSVEKALAITNKYDSPKALMDAYKDLDFKACELLLANLKFNSTSQRVGPAISTVIYLLFNSM